jgi:very-short-patch-repair endonuclease
MAIKLTQEEFIQKAKKVHKNKYGYDKSIFINTRSKLIVTCAKHGDFQISPHNLLSGQGCRLCGIESISRKQTYSYKTFIKKANNVHNNKYSYADSDYHSAQEKIKIICPSHGEFFQTPTSHLRGHGCPKCWSDKLKYKLSYTQNDFIQKARSVHGNKYNYDKVRYIDSKTKVIIICKIHGEFKQLPSSHLRGHGCSLCKESYGEKHIRQFLENNKVKFEAQKIFNDLFFKSKDFPLRYDFYLPDYNLLIEHDGEQHFKPFSFKWKKETKKDRVKNLLYQQHKDNIKDSFAIKNKIKLLRISFLDFNNIVKILKKELGI